jgi:hypothetical protein
MSFLLMDIAMGHLSAATSAKSGPHQAVEGPNVEESGAGRDKTVGIGAVGTTRFVLDRV